MKETDIKNIRMRVQEVIANLTPQSKSIQSLRLKKHFKNDETKCVLFAKYTDGTITSKELVFNNNREGEFFEQAVIQATAGTRIGTWDSNGDTLTIFFF